MLVIAHGLAIAWQCALGGGGDYELLFTAAPKHEAKLAKLASAQSVAITRIGTIGARHAAKDLVLVLDANNEPVKISRPGYQHFT